MASSPSLLPFIEGVNSFSGTIPSELGNLQLLNFMSLAVDPSLSGTIPTQLGRLTSLASLYLRETSLSGSLPTELSLLTGLTIFDLHTAPGLCGTQISVGAMGTVYSNGGTSGEERAHFLATAFLETGS